MPDDLTQEEKRLKAEAQDALIKHVFDNIRNLLICISLTIAGGAVFKYRSEMQLGSTINVIVAVLVLLAASGLFAWNIHHGVEKLIRPVKGTKRAWLFAPLAMIYMFSVITVSQALLLLQTERQLRPQTNVVTSNTAHKRDAPQAERP